VVESGRLESVCTGNRTGGSNPSLTANLRQALASLAATVGRPRPPLLFRPTTAPRLEKHLHELAALVFADARDDVEPVIVSG
jgi:hypothetical protein